MAAVLFFPATSLPGAETAPARWTSDDDMVMFFQAVNEISAGLLETYSTRQIVEKSLRQFVRDADPYSDYLDPEQYRQYRMAQQEFYAGVGMELMEDRAGAFFCLPYPGSPADQAGIREGDRLLAVDGQVVEGRPLYQVGALILGQPGDSVSLKLRAPEGEPRIVRVIRGRIKANSVIAGETNNLRFVRIISFTPQTAQELEEAMYAPATNTPLVLDLRGNPGGSVAGAVEAARLFLPAGKTILTIQTRKDAQVFESRTNAPCADRPLVLWQDGFTASAAEVFIAALIQNGRAVSIGTRTYGKGVTQRIVELMDGSGLILTDGRLIAPNGSSYHGQGLEPIRPMRDTSVAALIEALQPAEITGTNGVKINASAPSHSRLSTASPSNVLDGGQARGEPRINSAPFIADTNAVAPAGAAKVNAENCPH